MSMKLSDEFCDFFVATPLVDCQQQSDRTNTATLLDEVSTVTR